MNSLARALSASVAVVSCATPAIAAAQTAEFNVPREPVSRAIRTLGQQAGVQIIVSGDLARGKTSNAIVGTMGVEQALTRLLAGTGLQARKTGDRTFVLVKAEASPVSANIAEVGEIIVTAEKREQRIEDVPLAVSVLDGREAADRGVANFSDLVNEIPGLSINYAFGGVNYGLLTIRGIGGADDYKPNGNPSVALHVDGVYQTSNLYLSTPLFDLERVEVLKGPQGTLYGRNTTAGVINAITRTAGDTFEGEVQAEGGRFDFWSVRAAAGGPVTDRIGLRVAVLAQGGGGFMEGQGAGLLSGFQLGVGGVPQLQVPRITDPGRRSGWGDTDIFAGRVTLDAQITDSTLVTLRLFGSRNRGETQPYDRIERTSDATIFNAGENGDPFAFFTNRYVRHAIDIYGASGTVEQTIGNNVLLTVLANIQRAEQQSGGNGDGTPFPQFQFDFDERLRQSSIEARLSNRGRGPIDWVAGVFHVDDSIDFDSLWTSFSVRSIYTSPYRQTRQSSAVFGQIDADITDWLGVGGGLRYTRDRATFDGANIDLNPWRISTFNTTFATTSPFRWSERFADDDLSGRGTIQLRPTDTIRLFASAGNGYRGGGFDGTSIFTREETLPFRSERVRAFEAGARYTIDRLRLSFDAFDYRFRDLQATTRLSNDTNGRTNVGRALVRGLEGSIAASLFRSSTQSLDLNVGVTYLDTQILSFISNRVADVTSTVGDPLPGAPEWTLNAGVEAMNEFGNGWRSRARLTITYRDEESNRLNAQPNNISPAYTLINLRVDLTTPAGFDIYAYGRNLTNAVYFPELNGAARLVGAPLTWGVGTTVRF
jgi:outer membrane receptor protein involved in Fe transport